MAQRDISFSGYAQVFKKLLYDPRYVRVRINKTVSSKPRGQTLSCTCTNCRIKTGRKLSNNIVTS